MRPFCCAIAVATVLHGCSASKHQQLTAEWRPLEAIVEDSLLATGTGARTLGTKVYVEDLDQWLQEHPEPLYSASLSHEQVHARRQLEVGLLNWVSRYMTDRHYMLFEEQLGWYAFLAYLKAKGYRIVPEQIAQKLAGYRNLAGPMTNYQEALAWIKDVLAGRWRPPE